MSGGSWITLRDLILYSINRFDYTLVGYNSIRSTLHESVRCIVIPYIRYDKWGLLISSNTTLSLIFSIPLLITALVITFIIKPAIIIGNGLISSVFLAFFSRRWGTKIVVSHHGWLEGYVSRLTLKVLSILSRTVDLVMVNSEGSFKDMCRVFPPDKIKIVPHWAHDIFFKPVNREKIRDSLGVSQKFVILFVGRVDREKHIDILIQVSKILAKDDRGFFIIVGGGEWENKISSYTKVLPNLRYLGMINDRSQLRDLYIAADIVWSYADETYIAKPAVEALACGTPVLIPNIPAILKKRHKRISPKILPKDVGWIVETDAKKIADLLFTLFNSNHIVKSMRNACLEYARKYYSSSNLANAIVYIESLLRQ
ncbi:MAG: glycosyltransferase family 4 protein [Nitrososphaerota archaeon]